MSLYNTANKLANEIKLSKEYKVFRKCMNEIKKDKESEDLLRKYRISQINIQNKAMSNQKVDKKELKSMENLQNKIKSNKKVSNYINSEYKFTSMMENINRILSEELEKDYKL